VAAGVCGAEVMIVCDKCQRVPPEFEVACTRKISLCRTCYFRLLEWIGFKIEMINGSASASVIVTPLADVCCRCHCGRGSPDGPGSVNLGSNVSDGVI
jgi:hypothetical protein